MKKTIVYVLSVLILACALTGCGKGDTKANKADKPASESTVKSSNESTVKSSDSDNAALKADNSGKDDNPIKTKDKVSVAFAGDTITVTYSGWPASNIYDYLDMGISSYMKLIFTMEDEAQGNAGAIVFVCAGDGNVSSLIQFGGHTHELTNGTVTFGEKGRPLTCVFSGTQEQVSGILAGVDMNGMIRVNDSISNNYLVAYVKDAVTEE